MFVLMIASSLGAAPATPDKGVTVVSNEAAHRVDVLVDGQPFTSYIWPDTLKVPVLFPLRTASGTIITRGFPLEPRPGERMDHPNHVGLWLNYGNVNGVDFWNNSTALPAEQQAKMGTVVHRRIVKTSGGADKGELEIEMDWMMPDVAPLAVVGKLIMTAAGSDQHADARRLGLVGNKDRQAWLVDSRHDPLAVGTDLFILLGRLSFSVRRTARPE